MEREVVLSDWKKEHPDDSSDNDDIGLSSEEEADGLEPSPYIQRKFAPPEKDKPPKSGSSTKVVGADEVVVDKETLESLQRAASLLQHKLDQLSRGERVSPMDVSGAADEPDQPSSKTVFGSKTKVTKGQKVCNVCSRSFFSSSRLRAHMKTHTGDLPYECETCGKKLASRRTFDEHRLSCGAPKTHVCNVSGCGKAFATMDLLKKHGKSHQVAVGEDATCECGATFTRVKSKREHWTYCKLNPNKKGPFFCSVPGCELAERQHPFQRMKNLNLHLKKVHDYTPRRASLE